MLIIEDDFNVVPKFQCLKVQPLQLQNWKISLVQSLLSVLHGSSYILFIALLHFTEYLYLF